MVDEKPFSHCGTRVVRQVELSKCKAGDEAAGRSRFTLCRHVAPPATAAATLARRYERCRAGLHVPEMQLRLFYGAPRKDLEVRGAKLLVSSQTEQQEGEVGLRAKYWESGKARQGALHRHQCSHPTCAGAPLERIRGVPTNRRDGA